MSDIEFQCKTLKSAIEYYYKESSSKLPLNDVDIKILSSLELLDNTNPDYILEMVKLLTDFTENIKGQLSPVIEQPPQKTLKESTLLIYELKLKKLLLHDIIINPITCSIEELCETITIKINAKSESLKTYLSAILYYSKANKINTDKLLNISEHIKSINTQNEKNYKENKLSLKETKNFISWDNVLLIHKELLGHHTLDPLNKQLYKYYLMLSFYIYMPPRRILDYSALYYDNSQELDASMLVSLNGPLPDNPSTHTRSDDPKNYYVIKDSKGYFIFNNYKTNDKYCSQYFEIHPELHKILESYINQNNISMGSSILNLSPSNFSIKMDNIFKCYVNKSLGVSALRHIYIIHQKDTGNLNTGTICDNLAYMMAHSKQTQDNYYKITGEVLPDCIINKEGIKQLCKPHGRVKLVETPEMKKSRIKANKERFINKKNASKIIS